MKNVWAWPNKHLNSDQQTIMQNIWLSKFICSKIKPSISDAGWYQFTEWLDYFGKVWDKAVVSVSPNFTSADCSNCGFRVKKSLSTRTHKCPKCKTEICRDTNAALNILKKGMSILGTEYNSTEGKSETAPKGGTLGETSTAVSQEKSELISRVKEPRINVVKNPAL